MGFNYIPKEELYFKDEDIAMKVSRLLLNAGYVVMISKEEGATILNYIRTYESLEADRNDVIFVSREDYEYNQYEDEQEVHIIFNGDNEEIARINTTHGDDCVSSCVVNENFWEDDV